MKWWHYVLFPFSLLFDLGTRIRNLVYDTGLIRSFRFDTNVIAVGNLSAGGTGKTPMVEYLIRFFQSKGFHVSTLSRGYGRKTAGFRMAGETDDASTVGDEPFMYFLKYPQIGVAVAAERDLAIPELLFHRPETEVILLDDAFQHRTIDPSAHLLLTTFERPFYEDIILPAGRLRESRKNADRADIIVVTKCPERLSEADQVRIRDRIARHSGAPVFFSAIAYEAPVSMFPGGPRLRERIIGISGISGSRSFNDYLRSAFDVRLLHNYSDHHRYTRQDVRDITNELDDQTTLIVTEKDMVKLRNFAQLKEFSCYYLPIRMKFLKNETLFQSMLESVLKNSVRQSD